MNDRPTHERVIHAPFPEESTGRQRTASPERSGDRWRVYRWLAGLLAAILWLSMVYGLPLRSLRAARDRERAELTHLLQADKPDTAAVLGAFDYATEEIIFSATGPYLILAVATVFLIAHLVGIKRRLNVAERSIQALQDVARGMERATHQ